MGSTKGGAARAALLKMLGVLLLLPLPPPPGYALEARAPKATPVPLITSILVALLLELAPTHLRLFLLPLRKYLVEEEGEEAEEEDGTGKICGMILLRKLSMGIEKWGKKIGGNVRWSVRVSVGRNGKKAFTQKKNKKKK